MKSFLLKSFKIITFAGVLIIMAVTFSACISSYKNSEDYFYSVFELICTEEGRFDSAGTAFKCDGVIYTNAHIVSYLYIH